MGAKVGGENTGSNSDHGTNDKNHGNPVIENHGDGGAAASDTDDAGHNDKTPDTTVSVFGMSTEGYEIARQYAIGGSTVFIIDDANPTAILLNAEIARTYPDISSLREDEPIMSLEPLRKAISRSDYLFFAPRMRTREQSTKSNTQSLFKDAVEPIREGSSVIFCAPAGIGDNNNYASVLQHVTGLEVGEDVSYYYYPVESGRPPPRMIGSADGREDGRLAAMLSPDPEDPVRFVSIPASEYIHTLDILSRFSGIHAMLELGQFVPDDPRPEIAEDQRMHDLHLDGMVSGLFDMRMIELSLEAGKPLQRIASMYSKGVDSYTRRLIEGLKQAMRACDMRTNRTRVVVVWSFDKNLLRGDRNEVSNVLAERLRDWMAEVDVIDGGLDSLFATDKPVAVIPCSARDFERVMEAQKDKSNLLVMKANPLCEWFIGQ